MKANNIYMTPNIVGELKQKGFDVIPMKHAYRVNGCVDIWYDGRTLYDKKKNEYKKHKSTASLISEAIYLADHYGKTDAFKKTKKGGMTYQEFKHMVKANVAEYQLWDNDDEVSDYHLYFFKAGVHVKIGRSKNPKKRMQELKTGTPMRIESLCVAKNKGHLEKRLHKIFSDWRVRKNGEWFTLSSEILDFINYIKSNKK